MQPSPSNEDLIGTVPKPTQQHGHHKVYITPQLTFAVAAQQNVEIVKKKLGQRHMPALPEIDDVV